MITYIWDDAENYWPVAETGALLPPRSRVTLTRRRAVAASTAPSRSFGVTALRTAATILLPIP